MKTLLVISLIGALRLAASAADYSVVAAPLEAVIRQQMHEWNLGGVSVALVDDQSVVYAAGFGEAKRDSVFRVGSISKLFNAIAVMQQVEAGRLDLDAPLTRYGAELVPVNPFPGQPAPTLRQLLCHRSGVPREPWVGGYLDPSQPGLAATIASVPASVLVTVPGEKMRYSNLGPSLAGFAVERVAGQSFPDYQQARVFHPLRMTNSAWTLAQLAPREVLTSHMRVADGRGGWIRRETPVFDLGTIPAGNLFSSVDDLARFAMSLIGDGRGLLRPESLAEMWRPQLTTNATGFGLGFMVGKFRERRTVSHSGAVYGHSSSFVVLPAEKLAVIVLVNEDIANGRVRKISETALSLMLQARWGEAPPASPKSETPEDLNAFVGDYESASYWAKLEVRNGRLIGDLSGQPTLFTPRGPQEFVADSRIDHEAAVKFERDSAGRVSGFTLGNQTYTRTPSRPPLTPEWRALLGSYGPDFIPIIVTERHGRLYAMTENMVDYSLTPINRHACALPPGMYIDEQAVFLTDGAGKPWAVDFANMLFPRRP